MNQPKVIFDVVREIGLALPDVEETTMYGSPALKVRGKLLACIAVNKTAEPQSLGLAMDFEQREALLAEAPETFYVTDHYVNYPIVLVRLWRVRRDQLHDLLRGAWQFINKPQPRRASPAATKPNRTSKGRGIS